MEGAPIEVPRLLSRMIQSYEIDRMKQEERAAKKNPEKYWLSRVIADGKPASYRYYRINLGTEEKNGKAKTKYHKKRFWCYAVNKNVAGYYLVWLQIETPKLTKRVKITAEKTRREAREFAYRMASKGVYR